MREIIFFYLQELTKTDTDTHWEEFKACEQKFVESKIFNLQKTTKNSHVTLILSP